MRMKYMVYLTLGGLCLITLGACSMVELPKKDPLDGTSWELIAYQKKNPIPGTTITTVFEKGEVHGSAGCNSYYGTYQIRGDKITVSEIGHTMMACLDPAGIMDQETLIMGFMSEAQTFRIYEGQLHIFRADGEALTFIPQE